MGKPQFEDSWKDFFEGASADVPDSVWIKIENDLIAEENKNNKTRVVFYQRLAATVALFAILLASYIAYDRLAIDVNNPIAVQNSVPLDSKSGEANDHQPSVLQEDKDYRGKNDMSSTSGRSLQRISKLTSGLNDERSPENRLAHLASRINRKAQSETYHFAPVYPSVQLRIQNKQFVRPNFPRELPAMPSFFMSSKNSKRDKKRELLFASLGFAGGSYDPGESSRMENFKLNAAGGGSLQADNFPLKSEQAAVGSAYSVGISVGTQVAKRWVLQSGLGYMNQQIDYTSNYTLVSPNNVQKVGIAEYAATDAPLLNYAAPYDIRSSSEYVVVPLQVGYVLVKRKLGFQINTGISTDFFIRNTLIDESGQAQKFSQSAGEESPYNSVNLSGLFGFELSHVLSDHARLAIVPGVRYTFNSILKEEAILAYNPLVLDIGLRFRYVFQ